MHGTTGLVVSGALGTAIGALGMFIAHKLKRINWQEDMNEDDVELKKDYMNRLSKLVNKHFKESDFDQDIKTIEEKYSDTGRKHSRNTSGGAAADEGTAGSGAGGGGGGGAGGGAGGGGG